MPSILADLTSREFQFTVNQEIVQSRVNRRVRLDGQGGFDLVAQGGNVLTNLEVAGFEFFPSPQTFAPQPV
jgi:hypothetical protein